jgi:hypothetical protein
MKVLQTARNIHGFSIIEIITWKYIYYCAISQLRLTTVEDPQTAIRDRINDFGLSTWKMFRKTWGKLKFVRTMEGSIQILWWAKSVSFFY